MSEQDITDFGITEKVRQVGPEIDNELLFRNEAVNFLRAKSSLAAPASFLIWLGIFELAVGMLWSFGSFLVFKNANRYEFFMVFPPLTIMWGTLTIFGAVFMKQLQSYRLALMACFLSIAACFFIFSVPIGIWSLLRLTAPGVRRAFDRSHANER